MQAKQPQAEKKCFTLAELSALTGATLEGDPNRSIDGVETLESATRSEASFLANMRYRERLEKTEAGVICVATDTPLIEGKNFLISADPSKTFQTIVKSLLVHEEHFTGFTGIHPKAEIHPSAQIGEGVSIGPYAAIDRDVVIGDYSAIGAHVSIGPRSSLGTHCQLFPHSVVREGCTLGHRVTLQPGAVIGSCGFGYITDRLGQHTKLEQLGTVVLEDDVEIGANSTVDRARFKETRIKRGTKLDNLVQIGHNVILGEHNIIVSQTGIAGSTKTGRNVIMGGQAGAVGHIEIADFTMIATRGGVSKSIREPHQKLAGSPVVPLHEHNKQQVLARRLPQLLKKIEALEARLTELEGKHSETHDTANRL